MGIEATLDTPLAEAVRKVGSQSAFGRLVGKSQASVHELLRDNRPLWAESVLTVEAATGVSRYRLNPEVFGVEPSVLAVVTPTTSAPDFGALEPAR